MQLKRLILAIIALCVLWLSVQQNDALPLPLVFAQEDSSPLDPNSSVQLTAEAAGTIFPTVTPTLTGTATMTPTATPTPGNIAQIEFPDSHDVIFGFTTIRGTALIDHYRKYDLHISVSGYEDWQWLTTSYSITRGGNLFTLNTFDFDDGYYDLRLRAIQDGGNFNQAISHRVEIRNENPPTLTPVFNPQGTPLYSPLSPLITPTPTLTPDIRVRIPGAQGFYGPEEGSTIRGFTPIEATVNNLGFNFFERYELYISIAGFEEWTHLFSDVEQHWQDTIYTLNTTLYPDGKYDLRLRVVYLDGNYSEYHLRRLQIKNSSWGSGPAQSPQTNGFRKPYSGQSVRGTVNFIGTAVDSNFLRWELHWSPSHKKTEGQNDEQEWSFLVQDDEQVIDDVFARLDLSQLPAGSYDFRLRIVRRDYNYNEYFVRNIYLKH